MPSLPRILLAFCAAVLCIAGAPSHATVYKWVDVQGQTHYGERPPEAGKQATQVKVHPPGPTRVPNEPSTDYLVSPSKFAAPVKPPVRAPQPMQPTAPRYDQGTPESRCALARDVLSGAARHRNGKPTDAYDREVARNDVKEACSGHPR